MKVYKFGGASVRNAEGVRNLQHIVEGEENLFIVVSAMGKTTNALERVFTHLQRAEKAEAHAEIDALVAYHYDIINPLWGEEHQIEEVDALFAELHEIVDKTVYRSQDAELWYDRVVAYGELISTTIISKYLKHSGIRNRWIDRPYKAFAQMVCHLLPHRTVQPLLPPTHVNQNRLQMLSVCKFLHRKHPARSFFLFSILL